MLAKKNYAALEVENRERYRPSQCTNHKGTKKLLQGLERIGKGKARNSALASDGDFGDEGNEGGGNGSATPAETIEDIVMRKLPGCFTLRTRRRSTAGSV